MPGPAGPAGRDGATWLAGASPPRGELGATGDLYLETESGDVYRKDERSWRRLANLKSASGGPGATWYTGHGPPSGALGREGDLHLDLRSDAISRKTFGWQPLPSERPESARWTVGNRYPQSEEGRDGDFFLDLSSSRIHERRGGLWREIEQVDVPAGGWDWGRGAPSAESGPPGGAYLDTGTGRVYRKTRGWAPLARLQGPAGAPGEPGLPGTAFGVAPGAPAAGAGRPGDLHLDARSGILYQRRASGWVRAFRFAVPAADAAPSTTPRPGASTP